jgi:hypothetical protein
VSHDGGAPLGRSPGMLPGDVVDHERCLLLGQCRAEAPVDSVAEGQSVIRQGFPGESEEQVISGVGAQAGVVDRDRRLPPPGGHR